jgi:streptomycin 6-kinase
MEIVDDQTRVVFQEEFIPTNQVILRGDIQYENTMIDAGDYGWPTTKPHIMVGDTGLRPLFLYPSERHPAKRNPNYTP